MPVLHSTKNLEIVETSLSGAGKASGVFEYTDHYTVFHYGRMPEPESPAKGEATLPHGRRQLQGCWKRPASTPTSGVSSPRTASNSTSPEWPGPGHRVTYPHQQGNMLVPIQVLVRNELPQGSSVHSPALHRCADPGRYRARPHSRGRRAPTASP